MVGGPSQQVDLLEEFQQILTAAWGDISHEYDVFYDLPEPASMFKDVDLYDPCIAAETIVMNMLVEVTELVDRFSPWYTRPARSFGLTTFRDIITHKNVWRLAPEAVEKWRKWIEDLAIEIHKKKGLIEALILIDNLDTRASEEESILAVCQCIPPKELLVKRSFLQGENIVCNCCVQPFLPLAE